MLKAHIKAQDGRNGAQQHNGSSRNNITRPWAPGAMSDGVNGIVPSSALGDGEINAAEEDPRERAFNDLFAQSEAKIASLFDERLKAQSVEQPLAGEENSAREGGLAVIEPSSHVAPKKAARALEEDDYDDYDEEEEEEVDVANVSPLKSKSTGHATVIGGLAPKPLSLPSVSSQDGGKTPPSKAPGDAESVRRRLEDDKKAAEDAAKRSFQTMFYTLENDRDAMLERQKLEESDRQIDAEMSGHGGSNSHVSHTSTGNGQQGTLSSANLGASSLTLKHLIARIDAKRNQVRASDAELRNLMSEVRKNRSKWASEEKVGQEELYESAEKVLSELKAMTEHSTAFLTKVNKREAPRYHEIVKHPMDLGSMTKKLKGLQYKSKQEFVADLNLIWSNCLLYNDNLEHFLRKHAIYMRKETEKLVPLIPDIVIRDRAEVEAEERRLHNGDHDADGGEESDDEPIMSSRGRKAPGKKAKKGGNTARKAPIVEGTPAVETKPSLQALNPSTQSANPKFELQRADSDAPMEGIQNDLFTPPPGRPGTSTPAGINGSHGGGPGSQADAMDLDGLASSENGLTLGHPISSQTDEVENDNLEYKTWKQVTKRDRALVAADRNRLFKGDRLNADEPAPLRTKAGMRRWLRKQREAMGEGSATEANPGVEGADGREDTQGGETLAEGMEGEEERVLPDYYDTLAAIPQLPNRLRWIEDTEGQVQDSSEEFLRVVPAGHFTSPQSVLTKKMEANMRQMQETRKVCTKIGVVKQMQLQSQMYQNQFQKYNPEPFVEQDIPPHVVSDDGPIMSSVVCRAALQRSVGKIFYHAGFEEFQPSALEAVTDIAGDFFTKVVRTLGIYREAPKVPVATVAGDAKSESMSWRDKFTNEETILHCLHENGLDVEALESYVKEDVDRLGSKLGVMHDRMKAHLADLLRPALNDAGPDGANAFNDGSEQFVGGDFAEDLDEDFFGFKELGLDKEFGLASLSVPLHLLQNRMHNAYQAQNTSANTTSVSSFEPPPPYEPITMQTYKDQIGLVDNFFLAKLHANGDQPLVEDDDLPQKQRFPKPRLPPTGKISSPRKRPIKEQGGGSKKKKKTGDVKEEESKGNAGAKPVKKLQLNLPGPALMERVESGKASDPEKDDGSGVESVEWKKGRERDIQIFTHALEQSGWDEGDHNPFYSDDDHRKALQYVSAMATSSPEGGHDETSIGFVDILIALFLSLLPNLRTLSLSGMVDGDKYLRRAVRKTTFPDSGHPARERDAFRSLKRVSKTCYSDTVNGRGVSAITLFFRLPSIQRIDSFGLDWLRDVWDAKDFEPRASSVTRLHLNNSPIDDYALVKLLGAPRALKSFNYKIAGTIISASSFIHGRIGEGLQQQKHSLKYLGLDIGSTSNLEYAEGAYLNGNFGDCEYPIMIGSLRAFEKLVSISLDIVFLLGRHPEDASVSLVDIFPSTLEYYAAGDFHIYQSEESVNALTEQFQELLEQKVQRFPNWRRTEILQGFDKNSRTPAQQSLVAMGKGGKGSRGVI
ncbi:MAG: hypothetical protein M1812_000256 [Candelaria pacifica]|nr:MAG: hypothetical protein M1812_000256 [Candelaria pacifica]